MNRYSVVGMVLSALAGCAAAEESSTVGAQDLAGSCESPQIFGNAQHTGSVCPPLAGLQIKARITVDPDADRAGANPPVGRGFYSVHQGQILTSRQLAGWAFAPGSRGYTTQSDKRTKTWFVTGNRWSGGSLTQRWSLDSHWIPVDAVWGTSNSMTNRYEQLFQPVLATGGGRSAPALYVPDASGRVLHVDPTTGAVLATIDPLAGTPFSGDARTTVHSAISEHNGSIYYTVVAWPSVSNISVVPRGSWLVRVDASDVATAVPWTSIASRAVGVPQFLDSCVYTYGILTPPPALPWPATPDAPPPTGGCGGPVPAINVAPTFTGDGRIVVTSSDNNSIVTAFMITVDEATLAPIKAFSFAGNYQDGCGIFIPFSTIPSSSVCRPGSHTGVDPTSNLFVAGRSYGIMEAAPVVLPDGRICHGTYSGGYNFDVGHLSCFDSAGALTTFRYGWESTPSVRLLPGGSFELVTDDSDTTDGTDLSGNFGLSRLRPDLSVAVHTGVANDPSAAANDLLDGQPALDTAGNAYSLSGAGLLRRFSPSGAVIDTLSLGLTTEALANESAWGDDGTGNAILYVSLGGTTFAIGASDHTTHPTEPVVVRAGAKSAKSVSAIDPGPQ